MALDEHLRALKNLRHSKPPHSRAPESRSSAAKLIGIAALISSGAAVLALLIPDAAAPDTVATKDYSDEIRSLHRKVHRLEDHQFKQYRYQLDMRDWQAGVLAELGVGVKARPGTAPLEPVEMLPGPLKIRPGVPHIQPARSIPEPPKPR